MPLSPVSPTTEHAPDSSNVFHSRRRPSLHLISHDTSIPTDLDLRYDVRQVLNPAGDTRALYTGLSQSLQQDLLDDEKYRNMVDMAEAEIREEMGKRIEGAEAGRVGLTVGCMCVSGHHRSVAMAEELGKRDWPVEWNIEVTHRDLTDEVKDRKRMTRDAKKRRTSLNQQGE